MPGKNNVIGQPKTVWPAIFELSKNRLIGPKLLFIIRYSKRNLFILNH